jgi:multicomponent Na+:H+ antiporter subunit E
VAYTPATPPGDERSLFTGLSSLMPGSVPAGTDAAGAVTYHCLDTGQPITTQLAQYEALLSRALGHPKPDGQTG